jgi:hypothetical protein
MSLSGKQVPGKLARISSPVQIDTTPESLQNPYSPKAFAIRSIV